MADTPTFDPSKPFTEAAPQFDPNKPFEEVKAQPSALAKAIEPITSYLPTQRQMAQESLDTMQRGVGQLTEPVSDWNTAFQNAAKGGGNIALGGLGYVASPINAALRTVVGKPIEENTGIPKEIPELAASFALPIPKKLPSFPAASAASKAKTTEELFNAADEGYTASRASPYRMPPSETKDLANGIKLELNNAGYRDYLTPKTYRAIGEFNLNNVSDVADIDGVRKALNIAAKDPAERDAARRATALIDQKLSANVPEIAQARGDYAAGSRSEVLQEIMDRAGRSDNFERSAINQLRALRNSEKQRRGFNPEELAAMDDVINGTAPGRAANYLSSVLGGRGGLTGAVTGIATKGVAPVLGYAFQKLGNSITGRELQRLDELVRSRAPSSQSVTSSIKNWSDAAQDFDTSQSFRSFAKMSIASRNLSNNLKGVNINISPEDIMRTLQSPAKSAADQNQQPVPGGPSQ